MDPAQAPIRASTQEHLSIEDIKDDIVILKNGSCCIVLQTNAVNFNLLSETEQEAIIYAYAGMLNSLSFPIQIIIHSQHKDVSAYLKLLKKQVDLQKSEKRKQQIIQYQKFIEKTVKENEVLDKKFYIVIPFSLLELGISSSLKQSTKSSSKLPYSKEYILNRAKTNLLPKKDHLIKQFSQLGLKAVQLNTKQLIELFYGIYNPDAVGQKLSGTEEYSSFLVASDIKQAANGTTQSISQKNTVIPPLPPLTTTANIINKPIINNGTT